MILNIFDLKNGVEDTMCSTDKMLKYAYKINGKEGSVSYCA